MGKNVTLAPVLLGKKSQKQRFATVRTLAMGPDVILFDEPISTLDQEMAGGML